MKKLSIKKINQRNIFLIYKPLILFQNKELHFVVAIFQLPTRKLFLILLSLIVFFSCKKQVKNDSNIHGNEKEFFSIDSLDSYIKKSYNANYSHHQQMEYLNKSLFLLKTNSLPDTLKLKHYRRLVIQHYTQKRELFLPIFNTTEDYTFKLNDSSILGDIYKYKGLHYNHKATRDSAFYYLNKAKDIFINIKNKKKKAYMYYYIGSLQIDINAYMEAEINISKALKTFNELKLRTATHRGLNLMGIKCKNSSEYDLALVYYNRALKFAPNQKYVESVYNNIGTTYQSKNQHKKALEYFYKIKTDDNLRKNNVSFFAKIQGNLGYSKLNSGKIDESLAHLNEAIFIGDSINNPDIIATNKLRLATYYTIKKDTNNALKYINEALILAKSTKNYRDHLKGLKQLSSLDLTNSSKYLKEYIRIKDSISKTEQLLRDKFLRIANETDNIKKENHILQKKINTNTILAIVLILICLVLLFVTLSQKAKAAKLTHEKDQQKSNHEMYTLLLAQQHKLEEGKQLEKQRISEELHDSVLGKLFGTRINLESINSSNGQEIKSQRDFFIKEIKQIEEEIRNISHQLHKEIQTSPIDFVSLTQKSIAQKCLAAGITLKYLNDDHINWEVINGHTKINLYHILQETSKNCIKYTKSQYFYIEFNKKESYITLKIKYDGAELNDQSISTLAEFKNINSRIKKIKGTIAITSKLNKGTTIKINVPINEELNEKKT